MKRWRYLRISAGSRRQKLWLLVILAVLASLCAVGTGCKRPVVSSPAKARVNNMVNRILTAAVNKAMDRGIVDYGAQISLEKDEAGRVTALHTNMGEVNCLRALIEEDVLQRLGRCLVQISPSLSAH